MATSIEQDGALWRLTLSASRAWLNDVDRVYPVSVDPEAWYSPITHAYKTTGAYNYNYGIQIGNTNESGTWRTFAYYDYPALFGKQVLDANLVFGGLSGDSTQAPQQNSLHHASCFCYNGAGFVLGSFVTGGGNGDSFADDDRLTQALATWVDARTTGNHFMQPRTVIFAQSRTTRHCRRPRPQVRRA